MELSFLSESHLLSQARASIRLSGLSIRRTGVQADRFAAAAAAPRKIN
jgi:hypothetical protein